MGAPITEHTSHALHYRVKKTQQQRALCRWFLPQSACPIDPLVLGQSYQVVRKRLTTASSITTLQNCDLLLMDESISELFASRTDCFAHLWSSHLFGLTALANKHRNDSERTAKGLTGLVVMLQQIDARVLNARSQKGLQTPLSTVLQKRKRWLVPKNGIMLLWVLYAPRPRLSSLYKRRDR